MLTIRLQRTGKKNQADFRIVLAEKEAPVNKKIVEILGSYNPRKKVFQVKEERVKYWVSQRVEMSETIHNLFITKSFVEGKKVKAFSIPKKEVPPAAEAMADKKADAVAAPVAESPTPSAPEENVPESAAPVAEAPKEKPVEVAAVVENQVIPESSETSA